MKYCQLLLLIIFSLSITPGVAHGQISISHDHFQTFWAGKYLDLAKTENPEDPITAFDVATNLVPSQDRDVPGFGYTSTAYAAHLHLLNTSDSAIEIGLVVYGPIEAVYVQHSSHNQPIGRQQGGLQVPVIGQRIFEMFRYPYFKIKLLPGNNDIYLGEHAVAPHFPVLIMSTDSLGDFVASQTTAVAAVCALSMAILVMSTLVLLIFRDTITTLYFLSFTSTFLFNLYVTGGLRPLLYQILGTGNLDTSVLIEQFVYHHWITWWGIFGAATTLFGCHNLKIDLRHRSISSIISCVGLVSSVLLACVAYFNAPLAINCFSSPYQIVVGLFVYRSFKQYRAGYQPALASLLGWAAYTIATTVQLSYFFGLIAPSMASSWGLVIGSLFQFFLLGVSIFWERKYKEQTARALLDKNFRELAARDEIIQEFSSPKILAEISLGQDPRLYKSQWVPQSILYSDMRNFTNFIESAPLDLVEEILNCYMGEIIDCTIDHNGEVNKMIGDATLCVFDTPEVCLTACVEMRKRLSAVNRSRVKDGKQPIKFGTAASHARVISMNIGRFGKRLDRTVIGDEVNITARIESLTKVLGVDVLVSEHFQELIPHYEYQRVIGTFLLKGKSHPTTIHEVFGHNTDKVIEYKVSTRDRFKLVDHLCRSSMASEALIVIDELIKICPEHSFVPGQKLDMALSPIRDHILNSIKTDEIGVFRGKKNA